MIKQTLRAWLQELPEPYQSQAIEAIETQNPGLGVDGPEGLAELMRIAVSGDKEFNLAFIILNSFSWGRSAEKATYWHSVWGKLDAGEPLI